MELADKSGQVRQLEWTKSMLEICLKSGNTKVEMVLIQSSAATGSKEALHKEIKVLEHQNIQLFNCILTFKSHAPIALLYSMASSIISFIVYSFNFKDQLSSVEKEYNAIPGSEIEAFKQTIAEREREIAELSEELQTLQARLQGVSRYRSEEEEEELHRLTVETSELRAKLVEAEDEKQDGKRWLEATHQQMESFQQLIAELREKFAASQVVLECVCNVPVCIELPGCFSHAGTGI